jgi:hypothetical protein
MKVVLTDSWTKVRLVRDVCFGSVAVSEEPTMRMAAFGRLPDVQDTRSRFQKKQKGTRTMYQLIKYQPNQVPWNKGKLVGQKLPL